MKTKKWKKGLAIVLGAVLSIQAPMGAVTPMIQAFAYTERSATINADSLNVRSGAGTSFSAVTKLARGTAVTVVDETTASDGRTWYQIRFTGSTGAATTGYVLSTYVRFPVSYNHDGDFEAQLSAQGFPESYKDGLRQLHAQYPSWTFTAMNTGLDWNTVIQNESVLGRSLVSTGSISSFKSLADGAYNWDTSSWNGFDGASWVAASDEILRYYMDPRNFLDEVSVFQFLSQTYDPSIHTKEGLQSMLNGTFMEGGILSNGSAAGSTGTSTQTTPETSGGNGVTSVGPGVVGGGSSSSSNSSSSSSSGTTTSTPGGQTAVIVAPGGSQEQTQTEQAQEAQPEVRFEGPSASISRHDAARVTSSAVVIAGPGGASAGTTTGTDTPMVSSAASGTTYADAIMSAAQNTGVSPYVIAAMIIQEQGSNGRGRSISGTVSGYAGYYNYFNVGAYASDGMGAVERGLWYASQSGTYGRPWTTPESAIAGGAQFYGTNYVSAGQDTLYLKKYNVQGSNMYKHQYMTNVDGAASEGAIYAEGFTTAQKNTALNFKIPVYTNMPESPCVRPTLDGSPNNKLSGISVDGFTLTPTFNRDTTSYDLIVDHSVGSVSVQATAIDSTANVSGAGNITLQSGNNEIPIIVRAQNGTERVYTVHVVRQNNGPTYNAGLSNGSSTPAGGQTVDSGSGPGISNGGPGYVNVPSTDNSGTTSSTGPGGANIIVIN